jgi:hypothetical protein
MKTILECLLLAPIYHPRAAELSSQSAGSSSLAYLRAREQTVHVDDHFCNDRLTFFKFFHRPRLGVRAHCLLLSWPSGSDVMIDVGCAEVLDSYLPYLSQRYFVSAQ